MLKLWFALVVIVTIPELAVYSAVVTPRVFTPTLSVNVSELAAVAVVTVPINCCGPIPSATKPNLPNEEFELVRSH